MPSASRTMPRRMAWGCIRGIVVGLVGAARQSESDGRGDGDDLTIVGSNQLPAALVDHAVVAFAKQDTVVEAGLTAVDPVHEVVAVAPRGGSLTARPLA